MTTLLHLPIIFGISLEVYFILIILATPTFFIWRWLLKKFIKTEKSRRIATWTATIVTTPIIYVGLAMLWLFSISYYPSRDFNKEEWLSKKEKRYELSEDLIESKILLGKTKSEVLQILGNRETSGQTNQWIYYLGIKPGFANIDPDVLVVRFRDGKVISVK